MVVALETYIKAVNKDVWKILNQGQTKYNLNDNLTNEERKALYSLRTRPDIVIKKADKGSATVIISREESVREVRHHLQSQAYYQKLDNDSTGLYLWEVKASLQDMVDCRSIDKETLHTRLPDKARDPRFYILPKIHKPGNLGRPIFSLCKSLTEGIACRLQLLYCF